MLDFLRKSVLGADQARFWDENGYIVLRGFFDAAAVEAVNRAVSDLLAERARHPDVTVVISSGQAAGRQMRIADAPDDAFGGPIKINDLFMVSPAVRARILDDRLGRVLGTFLDGDPIAFNSLNFLYGSTQAAHYDSWFMPPRVKDKMLAVSVCLDRHTAENGPVFVYPGSHRIPPYVFPHGGIALLDADFEPALAYMRETTRDIAPVEIHGEPGDVLVWHGQLLHGGRPIADPAQTRRSLVVHYLRARDVPRRDRIRAAEGGYLLRRDFHKAA